MLQSFIWNQLDTHNLPFRDSIPAKWGTPKAWATAICFDFPGTHHTSHWFYRFLKINKSISKRIIRGKLTKPTCQGRFITNSTTGSRIGPDFGEDLIECLKPRSLLSAWWPQCFSDPHHTLQQEDNEKIAERVKSTFTSCFFMHCLAIYRVLILNSVFMFKEVENAAGAC